jgi:hypothetical protein
MEPVRRRVRAHDRYQVEFRLDYELLPRAHTRYTITTYIFVPQSLGIHTDSYPTTDFYRDIQNYVRLKTPVSDLHALQNATDSPLGLLRQLVAQPTALHDRVQAERFVNALKFFRAEVRGSLRAQLRTLRSKYNDWQQAQSTGEDFQQHLGMVVSEAAAIAAHFRQLSESLAAPAFDDTLRQSYRLTDESLSLVIEEFLLDLYRDLQEIEEDELRTDLEQDIAQAVEQELAYRRAAGYPSLLNPSGDTEEYLFRTSMLKKFSASVLYLGLTVKREGTALEHLLYAGAAGLSMIFATIVAFYFQYRYGYYTFPFFMALVVGYMFKDRIKEGARSLSSAALQRFIFDRRITIRTRDGKRKLGNMREKVTFLDEAHVPDAVLASRNRNLITELENEGQAESILCYTKAVTLRTDAFRTLDSGGAAINGIADIMRLDIRPYLRKMDDPVERRYYLDKGKLAVVPCPKVYYLNLISVYTTEGDQRNERLVRHQIALTRKGIRRIERC